MTTTEHPVRQLLWCALNALKTAQENHNITSETGLRHYLLEWLSGASRHPEFRSLPGEIMALKALTEKDRNIPIIGTLNTLFLSSATVGECPLFRFRAALVNYRKQAGAHMSAHGLRGCSMNPLNGPVLGNVICYN